MSLPRPWVQLQTDDGTPYFWNQETDATVWEFPEDESQYDRYYNDAYNSGNNFSARSPPGNVLTPPINQPPRPMKIFPPNSGVNTPSYVSDPSKKSFSPDLSLKVAGSHSSISLPSSITKMSNNGLQYENFANYKWESMKADGFNGERSGYLERLRGLNWYTQWFVLRGGTLFWFNDQLEKQPVGEIPITGATIEEDRVVKRQFAIHIFAQSVNRHYCVVPSGPEEYTNWMSALRRAATGQSVAPISRPSANTFSGSPTNYGGSPPLRTPPPAAMLNAPTNQRTTAPGLSYSTESFPRRNTEGQFEDRITYPSRENSRAPPLTSKGRQVSRDDLSLPNRSPVLNNQRRANDDNFGFNSNRPPVATTRLPPNWEQHITEDGYIYYWNSVTGDSSWEMPMVPPSPPAPKTYGAVPPQSLPPNKIYGAAPTKTYGAVPPAGASQARPPAENAKGERKKDPDFRPNLQLKSEGAHASITLPTNVLHTANFGSDDFSWAYDGLNEKKGILVKMVAGLTISWKQYLFGVRKGTLTWFENASGGQVVGQVDLKNSTVEIETKSGRPYTFELINRQKQHYLFSASSQVDLDEWITALTINGATDGNYSRKELTERQKVQKKKDEKEQVRAEEDYIKNREQIFQERAARQMKEQMTTDPINCYSEFHVFDPKEQDGKLLFRIGVTFSGQEWTVYRFEKQFIDLYANLLSTNVAGVRGIFPKKPRDSGIEWMGVGFSNFLTQLAKERPFIFADKKATAYYTRFIAPCQVGDEKAPDFAMPFKIETL